MNRAQRRLCWLLAGVIVLVALAVWQWRAEHADDTLLDLAPETVTRIDITWAGQPTRHYIKQGQRWYREQATSRAVDNARLDTMATLAATPVLQWRDATDVDATRIGLAKPTVVVQINGHSLAYGALAAFGPQRFVRVGNRIAVVPASYSPRPPSPARSSSSSSQKS